MNNAYGNGRPGGAEYGTQPARKPYNDGLDDVFAPPAGGEFAAPAPKPAEANEVVLSRPYQAHDIMVQRIKLRRPVTKEIRQCGSPLKVVAAPNGAIQDIEVKWDVVAKYIPLLAEPPLPPSTVDQFDFFDLDACAAVLATFFVRLG